MTAAYLIEPDICTLCYAENEMAFWKEAERAWPSVSERNRRNEEWREFVHDWHNDHKIEKITCFVFVADCKGDAISLCPECLEKITARVKNQWGAMPGQKTRWYAHEESEWKQS